MASRLLFTRRSCVLVGIWRANYSTVPYNAENLTVVLRQGYPMLSVPLPSKRESCDFILRPHLQNVGDFIKHLKTEDMGLDNVGVYSPEGNRLAQSTGVDILLQGDFDLKVNDFMYRVNVPKDIRFGLEGEEGLGDVRNLVHKLYTSLNVDQHQLSKELELRGELEQLQADLAPLEHRRSQLEQSSIARSDKWVWGGMVWMSLQLGFLARLTWWEYSWDIMEPVTYFVTYGTSMIFFAYYILTRQDYEYVNASERIKLNHFHKIAKKNNFDISKYNHLKEAVSEVEGKLATLRDPLQLNIPTPSPPKQVE